MHSRKAQSEFMAWFFIVVVLFAAAIFFLVLNKAWGEVSEPLSEGLSNSLQGHDTTGINITRVIDDTTGSARLFDSLIPFIMIGLLGFVLIMAGGIMRHPIMIFVGLIIMGVVILIAVVYSNVYSEISSSSSFIETSTNQPVGNKYMGYLPYVVFIAAIGIAIAITWRNQGGSTTL